MDQLARTAEVVRGRPRVHSDTDVLDATLALLAERGFQRMSLADVAERSGMSRPTIYRRWKNKTELVADAVRHAHRDRPEPTGDFRLDLIAELRDVRQTYEQVVGMGLIGTLLAEERHHPAFLQAWQESVIAPRRDRIRTMIVDACTEGIVRGDSAPGTVAQLLVGAYYAAYIAGDHLSPDWESEVVDTLLGGLSRHP